MDLCASDPASFIGRSSDLRIFDWQRRS